MNELTNANSTINNGVEEKAISNEMKENNVTENVSTETSANSDNKQSDKQNNAVTEEPTSNTVSNETEKNNAETEMTLKRLNKEFIYDIMSVPSYSEFEFRLVTYVVMWARRHNIEYEFDDYGNLYLTKGKVADGEYYPCVTAHLDSVQTNQKPYIQIGVRLDVKTRIDSTSKKHEIYVEGMGIGGDDKAGVAVCLSMFDHLDTLKACFFLEEEIGCKGSKNLNTDWFKDVAFVIGYDSPELNRAAYACSGVRLFNADFHKNHLKDICKKHGVEKFHSEPFTDVKEIREQTEIICMNFGVGYYNAHMPNEYCVVEEMDVACDMGIEIIEHLGTKTQYKLKKESSVTFRTSSGVYKSTSSEDDDYLRGLSGYDDFCYGGFLKYSGGYYGSGSYSSKNTSTQTKESESKKDDDNMINIESFNYIVEKYEENTELIKKDIEEICKKNNIDFSIFSSAFSHKIAF